VRVAGLLGEGGSLRVALGGALGEFGCEMGRCEVEQAKMWGSEGRGRMGRLMLIGEGLRPDMFNLKLISNKSKKMSTSGEQ
jgi:hypothetical protein